MGAMVNYRPILIKFGNVVFTYIKLIYVELVTYIRMEIMHVNVFSRRGVYMGAMVNRKPIFIKFGTKIDTCTASLQRISLKYFYVIFEC